jgi:hypothetical protein
VFDRCAIDEKCHAAFPGLIADFEAAFACLNAQPAKTHVIDDVTRHAISITPSVFAGVVHQMLLSADLAVRLPRTGHRAAANNEWDADASIHLNQVLSQRTHSRGTSDLCCDSLCGTMGRSPDGCSDAHPHRADRRSEPRPHKTQPEIAALL